MSTIWDDLLVHTADLARFIANQDVDAGLLALTRYSATFATDVSCSVQLVESMVSDWGDGPRRINRYDVYFAANYSLALKDQIQWTDDAGNLRLLVVEGSFNDMLGSGIFRVTAMERI